MSQRKIDWPTALWACASLVVIIFLGILAVKTWQRVVFPWDLYFWAESPFLTDMLKLEHHHAVYAAPADGNSLLYSPGLEYLCFAVLKPFGLELDIRFCRLISLSLALLAAVFAALAVKKVVFPTFTISKAKCFLFVTWGFFVLSLSKSYLFDIAHPENLLAFHAMLMFWLCFTATETKRFGFALAAMVVGGMGVFTKQTESSALIGAILYLAICNPWGWKRWFMLAATGGVVMAIAFYLLWLPEYARFYTLELPAKQGMDFSKIKDVLQYLVLMHGGILLVLCPLAAFFFWRAGGLTRRYLLCWSVMGCFIVLPAVAAFMKAEGALHNLVTCRNWMLLLVWPFFALLLELLRSNATALPGIPILQRRCVACVLCGLFLLSMAWLKPVKLAPQPAEYAYAQAIENLLRTDVQQGHRVMVANGTAGLIRAGDTDIPLDRANSLIELMVAKLQGLSATSSRLKSHYYYHIYLTLGDWYGPDLLAEINRNYTVETVIKKPTAFNPSWAQGFQPELMDDCVILKARQ